MRFLKRKMVLGRHDVNMDYGLYWNVLCCNLAVLGCNGLYWTELGCNGLYWAMLDCTGLYWDELGCTGLYWAVMGSA